jgi:cell division protein FtsW
MPSSFKLKKKVDPVIPTIGFILSIIGLVMILSSSQIVAADKFGDAYYFFTRQLMAWVLGLGAFFYFLRIPLERLYEGRSFFLIATLILLILVFVPGIGGETASVYRWVGWGALRFQPSEVAKLFLIIYFSGWLAAKGDMVRSFKKGLLPFLMVLGAVGFLIMSEPDLDTTIVITVTVLSIFFVAQSHPAHFMALALAGVAVIFLLIIIAPYRMERLQVLLNKDTSAQDSLNTGYHSQQALIAIGSGGVWGVGFGQGVSKYAYLPQSYTDSIFAVIAEELGFVRTAGIVLAYLVLAWRGFMVAYQANSRFVRMIAIGVTVLIITQTLINIGGMLNILPLSGIPLPFVSYGGTSLIITMAMLGLLTNASREVS